MLFLLAEFIASALVLIFTTNIIVLIAGTAIISITTGYWVATLRYRQHTPRDDTVQGTAECSDAINLAAGLINEEVAGIDQETTRVKTLVTDASQQLAESFHALAGHTTHSSNLVAEVLERSHKTFANSSLKNEQSFIEETAGALDQFIQILVLVSKQSLKTVYEIDDMVKHVDSIFALLDDVRHIADQTNFLSLNAAIEAARAGDAGRGFSVVAAEIRNLSNHSNELNSRIREQIENTKQAIANVRATVGDMAARDMTTAIHTKDRLNETFENVAEFNTFISGHISLLSEITQQINNALGASIRSLQFEDIVTQALHQTEYHVASLLELNTKLSTVAKDQANNEILCIELRDVLTAHSIERHNNYARKVEQESMREGDIDLF